jgi:hypothetical protein
MSSNLFSAGILVSFDKISLPSGENIFFITISLNFHSSHLFLAKVHISFNRHSFHSTAQANISFFNTLLSSSLNIFGSILSQKANHQALFNFQITEASNIILESHQFIS